ncbi:MAG: hypothetical protein A2027_00080 [Thermodesulfovibrio sp. RBG_19FT_COMBO_41_18]|nr:MAG: hypothetical protein A2027_00080 [Thermodesulfovibrio sp. RBG_19FT_COMBO_41_18]
MPERVMGMEEDPYRVNTIRLGVDLTYNNYSYRSVGITDNTESFEQRYSLDVKGLLVNPNLIVYNAGIEFVDTDTETTNSQSHNNVDKYVFGSTILRNSRIPLTLSARRTTLDTTFGNDTTTDSLGVDWYLKFRTLPWTRLKFDKSQTRSSGVNDETEISGIEMEKAIGPSDNKISYSSTTTSDSIRNIASENNVLKIRNDTTVPLGTDFYLGLVRNDFLSVRDTFKREIDTTAGSVGLRTEPIAGFGQNYNYTFTNSKSDFKNDGITDNRVTRETDSEFFNGSIDYKPTKRLDMFMKMQSWLNETNETSSATNDSTSKSMNLSTGVRSIITRELSTTESIAYSQRESTTGDPLTGKTERTTTDTSAALDYAKKLSWSSLSAGASLGHYKETVNPDAGGEGISYGFNTGLSGINMNYFTLSSRYSYSGVDSMDVYREEQAFSSAAVSSYIKDLPFTVSYLYHTLNSYLSGEAGVENTVSSSASVLYLKWLPINASYSHYTLVRPDKAPSDLQLIYIRDKEEDTINLGANLIYFKNTPISASAAYNGYTQSLLNADSGAAEESRYSRRSMGINGSHITRLFRGSLSISTGYKTSIKEDTSSNIKEDYNSLQIKGTYDKKMSRNMVLKLKAERNDIDTNGLRETTTSGETDILYRLRQWFLSAEFLHSIREQEATGGAAIIEDRVMLRLSRSFVRMF